LSVRVATVMLQGSVAVCAICCAQKQHGPNVVVGSVLVIGLSGKYPVRKPMRLVVEEKYPHLRHSVVHLKHMIRERGIWPQGRSVE
jgi:hypothetical protein